MSYSHQCVQSGASDVGLCVPGLQQRLIDQLLMQRVVRNGTGEGSYTRYDQPASPILVLILCTHRVFYLVYYRLCENFESFLADKVMRIVTENAMKCQQYCLH